MPDRPSVWAPPPVGLGGVASPAATTPVPAPVAPAAPAEVERYYLCCEVPSGDFVEVILAVSDGGRRRYFTTSDGDRLAEVDEYYFVRRSLGDARSMLELDAREMAELEAELNFVRPLRGRDPLAELAAEAAGAASGTETATSDATEPTTLDAQVDSAAVDETPAPLAVASESTAAPETDAEAWVELLRRAGFEPPELNLDELDPEPAVDTTPSQHPEALMTEPVLMQWAETIDRQPEPAPAGEAQPASSPAVEPEPEPETETDRVAESPPKLTLVPPAVTPAASTPRLTLVPGPPPEPTNPAPAPTFRSGAEAIPEVAPAAHAAPAADPDSNEETNPVAMMTNPTDALAPAASVTPIAAPAALHSAPAPVVDADAAAQVALAKGIAFVAHRGQVDQVGADYIDHPGRVAEAFDATSEPVATAAAWLHDVVERSAVSEQELLEAGVRPDIVEIVVLLTRTPEMSDDEYFARIRSNPLARRVKLADVADNSSPWRVRKLDYDAQQRLAAKYRHAREALG